MKKILYIFLFLLNIMSLSSCYDDISKLATNVIDDVKIDTTGIGKTLYVGYQEELDLAPIISQNGNKLDGLKYEWDLTELPTTSNTEYETISTDKELHKKISRSIASTPYTLKLTVTDTNNGNLQYINSWKVYVQSSFVDGLLISDTKDGTTSDLSFIKNKNITLNYNKEEKIYRDILNNANGKPYNGLMTSLTYEVQGYTTYETTHLNQVWALTQNGDCVRFNCEDFSINGNSDSESLIAYKPAGLKFLKLFKGYQDFFAYTTKGIYSFLMANDNRFGWYDTSAVGYTINNNIVAANSSSSISDNHSAWLDKNKGQFVYYSGWPSNGGCYTYEANSVFDPNDMSNQSAIAAIMSEDGTLANFLLKDDGTSQYAIYTLSSYVSAIDNYDDQGNYVDTTPEQPGSAKNKFVIPSDGKTLLDKAVSVFFAQKEYVLYVATTDGLYAITYGGGSTASVSTVAKFTPTTGEKIALAKLYQQGQYTNDIAAISGSDSYLKPLPWNNKAIVIATQKNEYEGKVYVIPLSQPGIGTLDTTNALTYDGFGKILDVTTIGY